MKKHHLTIPLSLIPAGMFLHLIIPAVLAIIIGIFFTVLTIFDPLYAAKRTAYIWDSIFFFGILQGLNAAISTPFFSLLMAIFIGKIKENLLYPIVLGASLMIHFLFLPIFAAGYYFLYKPEIFTESLIISFVLTAIFAPILGLIAIWLKKYAERSEKKAEFQYFISTKFKPFHLNNLTVWFSIFSLRATIKITSLSGFICGSMRMFSFLRFSICKFSVKYL